MTLTDSIKGKILKLHAMAEGADGNEAEARVATEMRDRLLAKHNVTIEEIQNQDTVQRSGASTFDGDWFFHSTGQFQMDPDFAEMMEMMRRRMQEEAQRRRQEEAERHRQAQESFAAHRQHLKRIHEARQRCQMVQLELSRPDESMKVIDRGMDNLEGILDLDRPLTGQETRKLIRAVVKTQQTHHKLLKLMMDVLHVLDAEDVI